ncbi:DUF4870 family protein [Halomonas daqiaonensis]|uniref:Uncharacterized membrane protein n=1 Tax=Halomonas daqiaonensis TaxID=650850 RepID=A0A1H7TGV9_9GAMM|nr:hypothetical protein [Halomonas daqiaonensis]SEL83047.1 Uncharacterized membrane protein [Halomonas daqiaonensis]
MTDQLPQDNDRAIAEGGTAPDTTIPIVVYVLHLAGMVTGGLTSLVGVVIAYVYRGNGGPAWLDEHYRYQIRTFWIALLYFGISGLLTLVLIGFLTWLAAVVWLVIRCVKGLKALNEHRAPENVDTWWV